MRKLLVLAAAVAVVIVGISVPEESASAADGTCSVDVTELRTKGNQRGGGQVGMEDHRVRIDVSWSGWSDPENQFQLSFDTPEINTFYPHHIKWEGDPQVVSHWVGGTYGDNETIYFATTAASRNTGSFSIEVGYVHGVTEGYPFVLDNFGLRYVGRHPSSAVACG